MALLWCLLALLLPCGAFGAAVNITIGGLFPFTPEHRTSAGLQRAKGAAVAIGQLNNRTDVLPGVHLAMETADTNANSETGTKSMFSLVDAHSVPIVVGAASSAVSMAATQIGGIFSVPLVSYSSTSAKLSNKQLYPFFAYVEVVCAHTRHRGGWWLVVGGWWLGRGGVSLCS